MPTTTVFIDTAADEARLVHRSESAVSRARRDEPTHPVHQPHLETITVGRQTYTRIPAADLLAWWPPIEVSANQWAVLRALHAGAQLEEAASGWEARALRAGGWVTPEGELTDKARGVLVERLGNTPTAGPARPKRGQD